MPNFHLAQINIGTMIAPIDDPAVSGFVDALEPINAIADRSAGFVWRLQTEEGDATSLHLFENPNVLINLSVWESVDALRNYVYKSDHVEYFKRRSEWFEPNAGKLALWWVHAGVVPDPADALRRIRFLERHGPSPYAFTFSQVSPPLIIRRTVLEEASTRDLVERLNVELSEIYGDPDANHFELDPLAVTGQNGAMLLAELDGQAVGCGAIRRIDDRSAEIKRMYVDPDVRGAKLGASILDQLESEALALGFTNLKLETGTLQHAAMHLYEQAGYTATELWGEYLDSPYTSRAYQKDLDGQAHTA